MSNTLEASRAAPRYKGWIPLGMDLIARDELGTERRYSRDDIYSIPTTWTSALGPGRDTEMVELIRWAFANVERLGCAKIAAEFRAKGILTAAGARFESFAVKKMLQNGAYAGFDKSYREVHEGIVSKELYFRVQEVLNNRARPRSATISREGLLSGILACRCGRLMRIQPFASGEHYGCPASGRSRHSLKLWVPCAAADQFVIAVVQGLLSRSKNIPAVEPRELLRAIVKSISVGKELRPTGSGCNMRLISGTIEFRDGLCAPSSLSFNTLDIFPDLPWGRLVAAVRKLNGRAVGKALGKEVGIARPVRGSNLSCAMAAGEIIRHPGGRGFGYIVNPDAPRPALERLPKLRPSPLRALLAGASSGFVQAASEIQPVSAPLEPAIEANALKWIEAAFVDDDELAKDILQILTSDAPADRKMRKAVRTDPRFADWPSTRWAKALRVSDAAVRLTPFWKELRTAARARGRATAIETG